MIISFGALNRQKVMQAFPLMREVDPGLELGTWVDYANHLISDEGGSHGIFGAERDGYVRAAFCYEVMPGAGGRAVLNIRNFVVLDMVQREAMANILYHAIADLALRNACKKVRVHLPPKSSWAAPHLEEAGYQVEFCGFACGRS